MDEDRLAALVTFLQDRVGRNLRSVLWYDSDSGDYEVVYGREDVMAQYDEATIERIVTTYEIESMGKVLQEARYEHGELACVVRCFEDGIEINMLDDGEGVVIGLEAETFLAHNTFVGRCMEVAGLDEE